eukprot:TRINITY_DN18192_c0_g1_i1.p1 TRINITY_DN18192_c0_g1~~TRINITY_DN18192_c0_g1_i1.p1  ORF type:complete len:194 (-),score=35.08 TRINITY_DN18192_c0_g1_i1:644-1225(-)
MSCLYLSRRGFAVSVSASGPFYPRAAVAALICRQKDARSPREYLLAQRSKPPGQGSWSLPGGKLELGEKALQGAAREIAEETCLTKASGLRFHPWAICTTDVIYPLGWKRGDTDDDIEFHYMIAQMFAFLTDYSAQAVASDDAGALCWATREEVETGHLEVTGNVAAVLHRAESLLQAGVLRLEGSVAVDLLD